MGTLFVIAFALMGVTIIAMFLELFNC